MLPRDYSKAIVIAKRKNWRKFCEDVESAPEVSRLGKILSKDNSSHLSFQIESIQNQ